MQPSPLLDRNHNVAILTAGIVSLILGIGVARFAFTSLLPPMLEDFLDVTTTGILASVNFAGYLSGAIFAVFIKDINTKVRYFRIGMLLSVLTTLVLGLSDNITLWIIARLIAGFGTAMGMVVGSAIVMTKLDMPDKTKAMGIHFSGIGIAILVTDLIAKGVIASGHDWHMAWLVLATAGIPMAAYTIHILSFDHHIRQAAVSHRFDLTIFTPFVILLTIAYFTEGVGFVVQATFLPDIINAIPGLEGWGSRTWTLVGLAGIPSCILWMRLAHRYGSVPVIIIGADPETDLAVLKIEQRKVPAIPISSGAAVRVGDVVLAIGNPFGEICNSQTLQGLKLLLIPLVESLFPFLQSGHELAKLVKLFGCRLSFLYFHLQLKEFFKGFLQKGFFNRKHLHREGKPFFQTQGVYLKEPLGEFILGLPL